MLADAFEAAREEIEKLTALIDPAVTKAARYLVGNAEKHPDACCSKCAEGLAHCDRLLAHFANCVDCSECFVETHGRAALGEDDDAAR